MNVRFGQCTHCGAWLPKEVFNAPDLIGCPGCNVPIRVAVFPALFATPPAAQVPGPLPGENEATCFYHDKKRALLPCDGCGRFLCALCDFDLSGQHLCPSCLAAGKRKGALKSLENHRMLYDNVALGLAVLPALLLWPSIVTAPMAIFMAFRYWNAPLSILPRTRIRYVLAIALAVPQIMGWGVLFYFLYHRMGTG
ncbi:MAG TPA: hypothetical protein VGB25_09265 [Candidatus Binatia bacterium]